MDDLTAKLKMAGDLMGLRYHHVDEAGVWYSAGHLATGVYCWAPHLNEDNAKELAERLSIPFVPGEHLMLLAAVAESRDRVE